MTTAITLYRTIGDFGFEVKDALDHTLHTDSSAETGGNDAGFRPMQLLLAAVGSCSAIDIVSILKKQRQKIDQLKIEVKGEREKGVTPSLWKEVSITFFLWGEVDAEKAKKAVDLSMEKYCSVAETLRRSGTSLNWTTIINETNEADVAP